MRSIVLAVLAALACAVLAAGCSSPCQELGNRLCDCTPTGTTKTTCERQVRNDIQRLHPGSSANAACSAALDTCHEPSGVDFCDFLDGRCGKAACGMSEEDIKQLRTDGVCE
jgi:hypothetical protein